MRELVMATIADQPDIEVVGEVQNETELADIVEQVRPDVLIIAMDLASLDSQDGKIDPEFRSDLNQNRTSLSALEKHSTPSLAMA
jgi:DNA-binding NarL/FixJ family response regulator